MSMGGGGSGDLPGMGFLQMLTNGGNSSGGGGGGEAPPPVYGNTTPGTPAPGGPQMKMTPGYAQPIPLFGNMSDADLAAWMTANGVRQPQGPGSRPAPAVTPAPAPAAKPKRKINYETAGR